EEFRANRIGAPAAKAVEAPPAPKAPRPAPINLTTQKILELVELKASLPTATVRRGQIVRVTIDGTSKPNAYTYSAVKKTIGTPARIRYQGASWLKPLLPLEESEAEVKPTPDGPAFILHDRFWWKQDLYVAPDAPPGKHT